MIDSHELNAQSSYQDKTLKAEKLNKYESEAIHNRGTEGDDRCEINSDKGDCEDESDTTGDTDCSDSTGDCDTDGSDSDGSANCENGETGLHWCKFSIHKLKIYKNKQD